MAKYEFLQPKFNEGVLAKSLQGRSSEEFYHYGYKSSKNMIPILAGPVVKRPGTNYIGEAKDPTAVFIPFFKDKDNTYILELGVSPETFSSNIASGDATVTVSSTLKLSEGQSVTGTGIPDDTTILSITNSTTFELTKNATATNGTASLAITVGYLRVWSQNRLLNNKLSSPSTYEYINGVNSGVFPWTSSELSKLKSTQSGDVIFVCCPTKHPQKIFRTLDTTTTNTAYVAEDDSVWAIEEFVNTDGPYKEINIWDEADHTKRYTLKLTTEPDSSNLVEIGDVEFNTVDNTCVLANHGLQVGQKIRLEGYGSSTQGWGNIRQNTTGVTSTDGKKQTKMDGSISVTDGEGTGTHPTTNVFNLDVFVIATTSTTFSFSDTDGGSIREFELVYQSEPTTASNTKVKLKKYVYEASTTARSFTLYNNNNTDVSGWDASASTLTYFTSSDVGRLIRINPLLKGGNNIGGIKWAWGIIKTVTNSGANGVITVELKSEIANTRGSYGTSEFRLGAFSTGEGFPHVAQIYQQRMVFAATDVQPSTVWLSETANFYSFAPTVIAEQGSPESVTEGVSKEIIIDSNALTFTLDSDTLDEIKWLGESKKLSMGTSAGVYMLYGSETDLSITPFRFTINRETSFSATDTAPVIVSNALLYTQIGGKDVQSLELEANTANQWIASKISMKGYDIIKGSSIQKMVWQERPFAIIWFMMADGKLLSLSYDRSTEFKAWSEHVLGGKIYRKVTATVKATANAEVVVSDSSADGIADSGNKILFTDNEHGLNNTDIVQLTTTGTLPTGLSLSTNYYVVNKTANTFKLALTSGGADILWTDDGGGTHSWHKPTIYTVAGDQSSMFVADKYATISNYADSNWNVSQEIMNVFVTGGNTEITTRLDSSGFASTIATNPIIEADGNSHAQVIDIDMIPTASHDQIWFKVKRTINGTDVYHVETLGRFPTEGALDRNEYVFSDSAVTGAVTSSKIISGLKHLRNEEVQIYYEGMQHPNLTVTNTGGSDETVTLTHTEGNEHVTGIPYVTELETLEPSAPENQFSYTKRLIKAAVLVEESLGIQLEYNDLSEELLFRTTQDAMGRQIPLFSGIRKLSLSGIGWDTHNLKIVSNGPFPMQLNAVIIEAETGGS